MCLRFWRNISRPVDFLFDDQLTGVNNCLRLVTESTRTYVSPKSEKRALLQKTSKIQMSGVAGGDTTAWFSPSSMLAFFNDQ